MTTIQTTVPPLASQAQADTRAVLLNQASRGARGERRAHKLAPIGCGAGPGDKAVAPGQFSAVGAQAAGHAFAQPAGGLFSGVELRAQNDSSTAWVVICGLTLMSGCTPIMRRVCCTTSLKTGAAATPPK